MEKEGEKSSLTLYRRSKKFPVKNPLQSKLVHTKHDDATDHDDDDVNIPTTSKYKCTQHARFKQHVACQKQLLPPSKPKANVQNPFITKLNQQQENQHSKQKQKVKEMSFKQNFWMRNSRIVFANSCPGLVSSGISFIS